MVKFPLNELTKSLYIFCWIFCYPFFVIPLMPTRPTLCKYGKSRIENPSWFEGRLDSSAQYGQSAKYKGYQLFFGEYFIFSLFSWSSGSWDWVRGGTKQRIYGAIFVCLIIYRTGGGVIPPLDSSVGHKNNHLQWRIQVLPSVPPTIYYI